MNEPTPYPIDDTEYTTPAQAAEIRRMKAELPLWQEMETMPPSDAVTCDTTADAVQALDGLETTIDTHNGQSSINVSVDVSSEFSPDDVLIGSERRFNVTAQEIDVQRQRLRRGEIEGLTVTFDGSLSYEVQEHRRINGTQGQESEQ